MAREKTGLQVIFLQNMNSIDFFPPISFLKIKYLREQLFFRKTEWSDNESMHYMERTFDSCPNSPLLGFCFLIFKKRQIILI